MKQLLTSALFVALVLPQAVAGDDFQREGERTAKDALEGKAPPALKVENWMNIDGTSLDLASLKGKVVVLDFWGTW